MLRIVLSENEVKKMTFAVNDRERVELMLPDYIVRSLQRGVRRAVMSLSNGVRIQDTQRSVDIRLTR